MTTFGTLALDAPNVFIANELYKLSERQMVLGSFARKEKLPQRMGKTIRLVRFKRFNLPTSPLTEGVPPDAVQLASENVDVSLDQWGIVALLTDVVQITIHHNALQQAIKLTGQAIAQVLERETAKTLMGGGTVFYAGAATTRAGLTGAIYLGTSDILKATVTLRSKGAPDRGDSLYGGVMPPQIEGDIAGNDSTFVESMQPQKVRVLEYAEIGTWMGVRWKRGNFLPYLQAVAAPTAAAATATKAQFTAATGSGGTLATDNYLLTVVARDITTDYERRVSIESGNIAVTGATGRITVVFPTSTNYVYDLYMRDDGEAAGAARLVVARQAAGSTYEVLAEAPASAATVPAAVGDTAGDEVFFTFIFGDDSFFTVELNGMSTQSYITPAGPSWGNPLAQGRKVGNKVMWKAGIIDPDYYVRIESNSRYPAVLAA